MKGLTQGLTFGWLEGAICVAVIVVLGAVLFPIYANEMQPPPSAKHLDHFQESIDADGLPVKADALIVCELDRASYLGEGKLLVAWAELERELAPKLIGGKADLFLVKTKADDFAMVKKLGGDRVRVYTGTLDEQDAKHIFADEMESGKGRHPVYRAL